MTPRQEIVHTYIGETAFTPFSWGVMDCAHWAAGMVAALSGRDFTKEYKYSTQVACQQILLDQGGVEGIANKHLGPSRINWDECRDGDIVLAELPAGPTLGIATPANGCAHFKTPNYVIKMPITQCLKFWSVSCQAQQN